MQNPDHTKNINALKRIEGQIRGIQRMIEDKKYCVDILNQISAVKGALSSVEQTILRRHLSHCVAQAIASGTHDEKTEKIDEIMKLIQQNRKA